MGKWVDIVATVAPSIATALGGPLAGLAVGAIGSVFGLDKATQEQVANAVSGASPSDLLKLKTAEIEFKQRMAELEVDLVRISKDDRDSARNRQVQIKDRTLPFLAISVTLGFFGVLAFMLLKEVPPSSKDVLNIMLGSLGTAWIQVMAFYFGSSQGSARKDAVIAGMQ
jgi:hypothetical protein